MTDSNSPEPGPKPGDHKPKNIFDIKREPFTPRPLTDPDPNYDPDQPDQTPTTDQETLFRAAAIKCAEMEEELAKLVIHSLDKAGKDRIELGDSDKWGFKPVTIERYEGGGLSVGESNSKITDSNGQGAHIAFTLSSIPYNLEHWTKNPVGRGFITHYRLGISTNTDRRLSDYLDRLKEENTSVHVETEYFFSKKGGYRKHIFFDVPDSIGFDPDDRFIIINDEEDDDEDENFYSGYAEMTQEDFELAGQALSLLKKRIENPNWDKEELQEKSAE